MKKILIVENDLLIIEMLQKSISELGHSSVTCFSSNLALNLIDLSPDIVLINQLTYIRNKQLFYHDKQKLVNACIIITAQTIHDPTYIKEIGASSFILKPFDVDVLKVTIKQC